MDHVDGHRTVGFVVSAYTRRRYHDKTFYNQNSILRTIELILGIDPLTQFDLAANPMLALFQADTRSDSLRGEAEPDQAG